MVLGAAASVLLFDQITGGMAAVAAATGLAGFMAYTTRRGKPVLCEQCGGKGHWTCVICAGTGVRREGGTRASRRVKCVACVGRGKRLCKACGATGVKAM